MRGRLLAALAAGLTIWMAPAALAAPKAHVWVTTPDGAQKMSDRGHACRSTRGGSDALTITVDPSRRYQTMDGFGASITDSSASRARPGWTQPRATPHDARPVRATTGCRSCASRWAPRTSSTARTTPTTTCRRARPTTACAHFSIAHDRSEILPLLRQALALNPQLKVIGDAVEPAGLDEDQPVADRRPADRRRRASTTTYARYFVKFVKAYRRAGRADLRRHGAERAAEPQPERLPRHGHAGRARRRS